MIYFFVAGEPKAQPRLRATRRGRFVGVYNPDTADAWKKLVAISAKPHRPSAPMDGAVRLTLTFFFQRPKSHLRKSGALRHGSPIFHVAKPDCDNAAKAVMDVLTTAGFWRDDSQVASLNVCKRYADAPDAIEGCAVNVEAFR